MKKVGLVVKWDERAGEKGEAFEAWLEERGIEVVRKEKVFPQENGHQPGSREETLYAPADLDCVVVLGGDGTFLSAARWIGHQPIPIMGVKFGQVGFLADTVESALYKAVESVLAGNFTVEPRMRIQVCVIREGKEIARETLLNDMVINKSSLSRLANIDTWIDDQYLTTFKSDGLIVSTPTGSTAYSLAAGGPIVHPAVPGIILSPICPFTLTNRPLILSDSVSIKIRLAEKSSDIMLSFDGQEGLEAEAEDTIVVTKSDHPVHMITLPHQNYFDVLKAKLRWSGGRS